MTVFILIGQHDHEGRDILAVQQFITAAKRTHVDPARGYHRFYIQEWEVNWKMLNEWVRSADEDDWSEMPRVGS